MSILAIHPGAYYHIESLETPRYAGYFDELVRPEDLAGKTLSDYNVLLVPCRTPADRMIPHKQRLLDYLEQGGTIVATGESHSELWLPNIKFSPQDTNYWWWLEKDGDLGVRIKKPDHSLFNYVGEKDVTWHLHGWFEAPDGVEILAVNGEGKPIFYIDEVTTKGKMVLTTLDPFYHHGSRFMPATTQFLNGFLPWVRQELDWSCHGYVPVS